MNRKLVGSQINEDQAAGVVAVKPQAITDNECTVFTSAFTEDKVLAT
jgi:hypothetical protein